MLLTQTIQHEIQKSDTKCDAPIAMDTFYNLSYQIIVVYFLT